MFAVRLQTSSSKSADAQGYFSATILTLVGFEGFALFRFYGGTARKAAGAALLLPQS